MKRQKSILSFFQKPNNNGSNERSDSKSGSEIRGSDTPPEKTPAQVLFPGGRSRLSSSSSNGGRGGCNIFGSTPLPFSSVMHKFVKPDMSSLRSSQDHRDFNGSNLQLDGDRDVQVEGCKFFNSKQPQSYVSRISTKNTELHTDSDSHNQPFDEADGNRQAVDFGNLRSNQPQSYISNLNSNNRVTPKILDFDLDLDNIPGPETPFMKPLVPGLKRVKDDCGSGSDKHKFLLNESSKRMKFLHESSTVGQGTKTIDDISKVGNSKFEWLNDSSRRDANRRRPGDPLYDKRTLYIPHDTLVKMSATQRQYWEIKCQYMDIVLFFKVGKFYELYELDAEIGQKELDWKMTHSGVGKCRQVGISEAGIEDAIQKLIDRGYKVGRIEQIETASQARSRGGNSVIQRKLVHVSTPSTPTYGSLGPDAVHLLALKEEKLSSENCSTVYGFAFVDFAALKFWVGSICDDASRSVFGALLVQISPKEVVYEIDGLSKETLTAIKKYSPTGSNLMQLTPIPKHLGFLDAFVIKDLIHSKGYFKESSSFWSSVNESQVNPDLSISALGGLINYLSRLKLDDALWSGDLLPYEVYKTFLKMNGETLVNLEIFGNNVDGGLSGTLYKYLDQCFTSSGKRLLKRWICHPLRNINEINNRLNVVEGLIKNQATSSIIAEYLCKIPDLERLLGLVKSSVLSSATYLLPTFGVRLLKKQVKSFGSLIKGLIVGLDLLKLLLKDDHECISFCKVLDLPILIELDEALHQFEVAVQEDFPHYQDHEVQESDAEVLHNLVRHFVEKITEWSQVIHALNCVDVLNSFAMVASLCRGSTCRPNIVRVDSHYTNSCQAKRRVILKLKGLWHPYAVTETDRTLVPNDIHLGEDSYESHPRTLLLTGPNMGGKSTLLRATCLTVILAQLGCFVPCDSCILSPVDVIFTRLGAMDRIMSGESTFFIECAETATILQNATQDSLVLLDELGRGTSTFDGYAIAYAVFRHLLERVQCRLLFATHYHPLTKEFASHPQVSLQHMACSFNSRPTIASGRENNLVFLYRLAPGACPESYGMQVALMAGIPNQVVQAASHASQRMKEMVGGNFKSSENRCLFSTVHEDYLTTLLALSKVEISELDEDGFDTFLCLWHEIKILYGRRHNNNP